jgi:hypothetical protein
MGGSGAPVRVSSRMATGCVILFLVPFAAVGTFCAVKAVRLANAGVWPASARSPSVASDSVGWSGCGWRTDE